MKYKSRTTRLHVLPLYDKGSPNIPGYGRCHAAPTTCFRVCMVIRMEVPPDSIMSRQFTAKQLIVPVLNRQSWLTSVASAVDSHTDNPQTAVCKYLHGKHVRNTRAFISVIRTASNQRTIWCSDLYCNRPPETFMLRFQELTWRLSDRQNHPCRKSCYLFLRLSSEALGLVLTK